MNQRIKELMTECNYVVDGTCDNTREQKFAQLIVKECMDIARTVGNISEPDDWALDRCYEIEQRIQDHFGVEE